MHHLGEDLTRTARFLLRTPPRLFLGPTTLLLQTPTLFLRAARSLDAVRPGLRSQLLRRRSRLLRLPTAARSDEQRADQGRKDDSLLHLPSP
ncbi:MAG TPA: hypothetical protein VIK91_03065 [Nannocystis sp.]